MALMESDSISSPAISALESYKLESIYGGKRWKVLTMERLDIIGI